MHYYISNFVNSCDYFTKTDLKNVKVAEINLEFSRIDWDDIFADEDINSCVDSFDVELNKINESYIPKFIIYPSKYPIGFLRI